MTSTARSGSNLIAMMMNANEQIMVPMEPYLELFRSFRNAIVRQRAPHDVARTFDPASPLQDHYFTDERVRLLDLILDGDLETPFDPAEWDGFVKVAAPRTALACSELLPFMDDLRGGTYKEMCDNALEIIARARDAHDRKWVGFKEVWTIEFFPALARAYPDARFIIIRRDPRATLNSNLGAVKRDPLGVAHALSYVRHWRKYVAHSVHYRSDPLFAGRLLVVTHEEVLREPERMAREICNFLEVDFDPAMLDTNKYFDFATGSTWRGNSTFEEVTSGISVHRAERWRSTLDPRVAKMIEFTCRADMILAGDGPLLFEDVDTRWPSQDILEYLIEGDQGYWNWRSDLGDPQQDYGYELFRRALLELRDPPEDRNLIRRSFLFEDVYASLRQAAATYSASAR